MIKTGSMNPPVPSSLSDTDEALLARTARGDHAALASIAARHEHNLLGLARAILGGRADLAADAVQDSWVRVIRHARSFSGRSSVKTWLYRIVINRSRDLAARSTPAALNGEPRAPRAPHPGAEHDDLPGLAAALAELPESARLILLLCYHRGITHEQAADVLEIPLGTLKSRLNSALKALRERLREEQPP